jgi:hypothetical protein
MQWMNETQRAHHVVFFMRFSVSLPRSSRQVTCKACTEVIELGDQKDSSETSLFISHIRNFDNTRPMISGVILCRGSWSVVCSSAVDYEI